MQNRGLTGHDRIGHNHSAGKICLKRIGKEDLYPPSTRLSDYFSSDQQHPGRRQANLCRQSTLARVYPSHQLLV